MRASLLAILRSIPDHRRTEGRGFELVTALPSAILAMVGGANSFRQAREFIRIHMRRLDEAVGLKSS